MLSLIDLLAQELAAQPHQVEAAVALLDAGATVPFIARYRKEVTGGLDDTQLRLLEQRLAYLRDLEERRAVIVASLTEQGVTDAALHSAIATATTKQRLEDLYLPYKPKRRTKAQLARAAGLAPLAEQLLANPDLVPTVHAAQFVDANQGVADVAAALEGARQILMEQFTEDAELTGRLRDQLWERGILTAQVVAGKEQEGAKFADYFAYRELIRTIPSHRALALFRGRNQGVLTLDLLPDEGELPDASYQHQIAQHFGIHARGRAADDWLIETVRKAWRVKLFTRLELELKGRLLEAADAEAIRVFALNLKDLLLAAPAGRLATMGLDPGLRTGVKVAVVDNTGRVVVTGTIYPHVPKNQWDASLKTLATLVQLHGVQLVSIGNGTGGRETERLVRDLIRQHPEFGLRALLVSEAGASVYSASEYAAHELPELDVSLRGAVSIARRLQDPLAELVKIDPKAIGVGQYQHDVNQAGLARSLELVVEDCVNAVGVELNTASVPLLARVSGLNNTLAENIVRLREERGAFKTRRQLLDVPRLGAKTFEQCAGFLRIPDGDEPLDASAVHPEAYPVVRRILARVNKDIRALIGDRATLRQLNPREFADPQFGEPTVRDILAELEKPGRDPRPEFKAAALQEGVESIGDLTPGMILEGTVTNVANFGAFVDIGVHQDGLVHVSMLADHFVKDPREVVKSGQVVRVKVLEIDLERRRIALSLRLDEPVPTAGAAGSTRGAARSTGSVTRSAAAAVKSTAPPAGENTLAAAFANAKNKRS
ncbi:RNA-binding transcriptional accessory protein [Rhodoferax sp. 4810]|uniref:RNA-binding transcriptional accessory protein n=1 Tax=Thiospirillum jenense TaxID=1653858 RepID=A0A839HFE1_9GAMM|nr:Tex family protein [Thiospirillum jenense]MBB1075890.1 RNA-binding transcriptional accessory protein [Rhodoferax jenense]MBB1126086.1 RNA-binding transcriptional accessory protein [Thiospirillum jenense]